MDYLVKPFSEEALVHKIALHLRTHLKFKKLREEQILWDEKILPSHFSLFRDFLAHKLSPSSEKTSKLDLMKPSEVYLTASQIGITEREMAKFIAQFLNLDYMSHINPEEVKLGVLAAPFSRTNQVVPVGDGEAGYRFVVAQHFLG